MFNYIKGKKEYLANGVLVLENGGIGYNDAIPAANKTLQALLKAEK